jgi:CubicO group peptidase (beta-lactamase class C family)
MRTLLIIIGLVSVVVLAALALLLLPQALKSKPPSAPEYWPTQGWQESTPEEQGIDSDKLAEGLQAIQDQHIRIDSLLIIRNGAVVLDAYIYPYTGVTTHDLASVTKSFMTTLIGIAAGQGKVKLDQPMVSYFPERMIANLDERKGHITVRHLAGMVNGLESGCIAGDRPTISKMMANPDWVQAALDRKMVGEPGASFCYDSPGMHLLSAILQNATGMTALEFARQNLFEPLGIKETIWESDPQGFTQGWGDLHLKPRDAAKLGYLFLHQGMWEGKQIVPADWAIEAVKLQTKTGEDDDYGYGWRVTEGAYYATGRGGQRVLVVPSLNVIVVTTGSGFEFDEIEQFLVASIVDNEKPLEANPEGVARLKTTLAALAQAPAPQPVGPLPEAAKAISGKTYVFPPNSAGVETASLEFNDPAEAILHLKITGKDEILSWPIGLDDVYRTLPDGSARRGSWVDPQTFVFEVHDVVIAHFRIHFDGNSLAIVVPEMGIQIEGQQKNP